MIKETVDKRLEHVFDVDRSRLDLRMEIIGVNGLYGDAYDGNRSGYSDEAEEQEEVILRVAGNAPEKEVLVPPLRTVSTTLPGPAGIGIAIPYQAGGISEKAEIVPIYVPREEITENVDHVKVTEREVIDVSTEERGSERTPKLISDAETLYDVAHARAGDKQDISNITVIPYDDAIYDDLVEIVTLE